MHVSFHYSVHSPHNLHDFFVHPSLFLLVTQSIRCCNHPCIVARVLVESILKEAKAFSGAT